jgi:uncharacterized protein (DUF2147 family)
LKKLLLLTLFFLGITTGYTQDLTGFWQTVDKKTHKPNSVIAVYPYQGKYIGRIVATFSKDGMIDETIYNPQSRAPGVVGKPYYCGLDFIWVSPDHTGVYKGYVIDPQGGKSYSAKMWKENGNLILRGELAMFGRNEVLYPFPAQNFNTYFQEPDIYSFVPVFHKVKN